MDEGSELSVEMLEQVNYKKWWPWIICKGSVVMRGGQMFSASSFEILKYKLVGFACLSNSETFSVTHYELNLCHTAHIFLSLTIRPQQLVCWYWGLQDYTFSFWDFLYSCWSLCQHRKKRTFWMITTNKRTNLQEQTDFYMKWAGTQGGG